ncbi:hypothetical protein ACWDSL_14765 [Streptomyces sp. NPDC000941]
MPALNTVRPATALTAAALLAAGITLAAAPTAAAAQTDVSCPSAQWYADDIDCRMTHNGPSSRWYEGEWVAVHITRNGTAWANGYDPHAGHYYSVLLSNGSTSMYSEAKYGGTGVGVSVGTVSVTSQVKAALGVRNGNIITVTRNA